MKSTDLRPGLLVKYKPYKYDSELKKARVLSVDSSGHGARHKIAILNAEGEVTTNISATSRALQRKWTTEDETKFQELAQERAFQEVKRKLEQDEAAREQAAKMDKINHIIAQLAVLGFEASYQQLRDNIFGTRGYGYVDTIVLKHTEELAPFLEPLVNKKLLGNIFDAPNEEVDA